MSAQGRRTRGRIVATAESLFAARGYSATSVDDIADACAVSKGTVYHYFSDKTELFSAAYAQAWARVRDTVSVDETTWPTSVSDGVRTILAATTVASPTIGLLVADAETAIGVARRRGIEQDCYATLLRSSLGGTQPTAHGDEHFVDVAVGLLTDLIHDTLGRPLPAPDSDVISWLVGGLDTAESE